MRRLLVALTLVGTFALPLLPATRAAQAQAPLDYDLPVAYGAHSGQL
jgi:hypothetical protein